MPARIAEPIRRELAPAFDIAGPMPHPILQSLFDPLVPPGLRSYVRADFTNEIGDEAIDIHMEHAARTPTMHSVMHLYPINGAAGRVGKSDTAWSYHDSTWAMVVNGVDLDPANRDTVINWANGYWSDPHTFSAGGAYLNFMMDEGEDRVRATYRGNYERLSMIKTKYDPDHFFRMNQKIVPCKRSNTTLARR
jgi:hypothetical protein